MLCIFIFLVFVLLHWVSAAWLLGTFAAIVGLYFLIRHMRRQDAIREAEKDAERAERARLREERELRLAPLAPGETLDDRIEARFHAFCGEEIAQIGAMIVANKSDWEAFLAGAVEHKLLPHLTDEQGARAVALLELKESGLIYTAVLQHADLIKVRAIDIGRAYLESPRRGYHHSTMSPQGFEQWCRDTLRKHGWEARLVGAVGDQGADVIAERSGVTMVVQCKYYSSSVGNTAVQEVHAAKSYYGATRAIVVTNASYTRGAQDLAARTGVLLLTANQLMQGLHVQDTA